MPSRAAATPAVVAPAQPAVPAPSPAPQTAAPSPTSSWVHAAPPTVSLSNNNLVSASPGSTSAAGGGEPMHSSTQRVLESSYSANLHSVRVHTDSHGQDLAQSLSARAVTYGNHIFLGPGERQTDLRLMAHETAHVLQQRAAPVVHLWAPGEGSNSYEHEAHQAADAVMRHESFNVQQQTAEPQAQRLGLSDALNFFADKANMIPGFRMFTIVIGMNPINGATVERSPGNIIRAIVEFLPGGGFVVQALENSGVFDKVGNWVAGQLKSLGMVGSSFKKGIDDFLKALSWKDIFNLGGVWERAKAIFTGPITQLISFVKGLITGIIQFVKDAILKPLAKLAEGTEGYNLLKGILGKDPITGEAVPRSAETLLGPLLKMIGLGDVWQKMQDAKAIPRAWAWFQGTMGQLVGFVSQIPGLFVTAFKSLTIEDIILVPKAFAKLAAVFGGFLGKFVSWGIDAMFKLLEIVFDVVSPGAFAYIKKTGSALKAILKNPLPFVGNLVKAAKLGFTNFAGNILGHLKKGLIDWLTGSLEGVYIPTALSLIEFGKMAISILGISWAQIRGKIVKALGPNGEMIMSGLEAVFDVVKALINGGPAAAWEVIKDKLTTLKDTIVQGIISFVTESIVTKAVPKLIAMFIPGAGFISAIISIYDVIKTFIEKLSKIAQVIGAFVNSIVSIAAGNIGGAAAKVESVLAGLLSLAISFLAGFVGLGKVTSKIKEVINKVRTTVDKAIEAAVTWLINKAKSLFASLFSSKSKKPDTRTEQEKKRDKLAAIAAAEKLIPEKGFDERKVRSKLGAIKTSYKLLTLNLVIDSKKDKTETIHFTASASEEEIGKPKEVKIAGELGQVTLTKPFIAKEKGEDGKKLPMTRAELRRQVDIQQAALNNLTVGVWKKNWEKFYGPSGGGKGQGRADESKASADRAAAVAAERLKFIALWMANNPGKPKSEAEGHAVVLFAPRPGDKSYPFLNKSITLNGVTYVNEAYGKAILHAADQGAGGGSETAGLGGARENSSIGAQWDRGGRARDLKALLDAEIAKAAAATPDASEVDKMKLKVVLPVIDG